MQIGLLSATDPDDGDSHGFSLFDPAGDTDNSNFVITDNRLFVKAGVDLDHEANGSYSVRVRATDSGPLHFNEVFTIHVNDRNEVPTDINLTVDAIDENTSTATDVEIGLLSATDPDDGDSHEFSLFDPAGDTDNSNFVITDNRLFVKAGVDLDHEANGSYSIRVRATDSGLLHFDEAFTIHVNDRNEVPTDIDLTVDAIDENTDTTNSVQIGLLSATDIDDGDSHGFSLETGEGDTDNSSFVITDNRLFVKAGVDLDHEANGSYSIRVRATDAGDLHFDEVFTIHVNDLNEAPTDIDLTVDVIDENTDTTNDVQIGLLSATDPDDGDSHEFALFDPAGDTDNSNFVITDNRLFVKAGVDLDHEANGSYSIRVRATDAGPLTFDEVFTIHVNDLNEAPTDIDLTVDAIDENTSTATDVEVGLLSATDIDDGDSHEFSLFDPAGDTDNGNFVITDNRLFVKAGVDLDHEANGSYSIRVRATDSGQLTFDEAFTINVNDRNEEPTDIDLTVDAIDENTSTATDVEVGLLSATDIDDGDSHGFSLAAGEGDSDNSSFVITDSRLFVKAGVDLDHEANGSYSIRVRATDSGQLTFDEVFTIHVNDLNEAPTDIDLTVDAIDENTSTATDVEIGVLSATDIDDGDSHEFALFDPAGDTDNGNFVITDNRLFVKAGVDLDHEATGSYSIRVRATDAGPLTFDEVFTIHVNDLNEAPTDIDLTVDAIDENTSTATDAEIGVLSATDIDDGDSHEFSLAAGEGDTDNSSFVISDNRLLVKAGVDLDHEANGSYSIRVRATDSGQLTFDEAFTIHVNDLNEAPTDIDLTVDAIDENTSTATDVELGVLSATDIDDGDSHEFSLFDPAGDTDNSNFVITGNRLFVKAGVDLDHEAQGSYSIRVRATDSGQLHFDEVFTIRVNDLNEAPTDIRLSSNQINENVDTSGGDLPIATLSAEDDTPAGELEYSLVTGEGDADNLKFVIAGDALQLRQGTELDHATQDTLFVRVQVDDGEHQREAAFTITVTDVNSTPSQISILGDDIAEDTDTSSPQFVGRLTAVDDSPPAEHVFALVGGTGSQNNDLFIVDGNELQLRAGVSIDHETAPELSIRLRVTDGGGLQFEQSLSIQVTNVNEPPSLISADKDSIEENLDTSSSVKVASLTVDDPDTGDRHTLKLVGTDNDNLLFAVIDDSELRLKAGVDVNHEQKPSYLVQLQARDEGGLVREQTLIVEVTDVAEAPTGIVLQGSTIDEHTDTSNEVEVGKFTADDEDAGDTHAFSLAAGSGDTDNSSFDISGNKLVVRAGIDLDHETQDSYSILVRATDSSGLTFDNLFTIDVNDLNEAPSDIGLSVSAIDENTDSVGALLVGVLSAADIDDGDSHDFSLVAGDGGTDNNSFDIANNQLLVRSGVDLDHETRDNFSIRVRATDEGGLTFDKVLVINVNDVNEAPSDLDVSPKAIRENTSTTSAVEVGTLSANDADDADSHVFVLVAGAGDDDNIRFDIDGDKLQVAAGVDLDHESQDSFTILVRATDQGGLSFEKNLTIDVSDLNEAPEDIDLSASSLAENTSTTEAVQIGTLSATDEDDGDSHTFTLAEGSGDADNASFVITDNHLFVRSGVDLDHETQDSYSIRVRASDQGGLTFDEVFTIGVDDVNEAPLGIELSVMTIDEHTETVAAVQLGVLSAVDGDDGETHSFLLVDGSGDADNSSFDIAGNKLFIRAGVDLDHEGQESFSIRVRTTDAGDLTFDMPFTISVADINEPPTNVDLSVNTIDENTSTASAVELGAITATDIDAEDSHGFSLVPGTGDADNSSFDISDSRLFVKAGVALDHETQDGYSIRVRTTDSGGLKLDKVFTIHVNDVNEAPTDIDLSAQPISENTSTADPVLIGTLSATDGDEGDSHEFSLFDPEGDTDNSSFDITDNGLFVRAGVDLDHETQDSYSVRVRATDSGGLTLEKVLTIHVDDVNETPSAVHLSINSIAENTSTTNAVEVGTLSAADLDDGDTHGFSLVAGGGDADNSSFDITGNKLQVRSGVDLDHETQDSYSVRVRTTDSGGLTLDRVFMIHVDDVNEAPTDIGLSSNAIAERTDAAGAVEIGTLSATDIDAADSHDFSLVSGAGGAHNDRFDIIGDKLVVRAGIDLDHETQDTYSVRVRTIDSGGLRLDKVFTIHVNDVNEAPTGIDLSANAIAEDTNTTGPVEIGTLSGTDADAGDSHVFSLVSGTGDADNNSFEITDDRLILRSSIDLDHETQDSYTVRVQAIDSGGLTLEKAFTIRVDDVNEAPTDVTLSENAINENTSTAVAVEIGMLSATDVDAEDTHGFSLVAGTGDADNDRFDITGNKLFVRAGVDLDHETQASYSVRVSTTDSGGLALERTFTIDVNDVNDRPTDLALSSNTIDENTDTTTALQIGTLSADDVDEGDSHVFALVAGSGDADNDSFQIIGNKLEVKAGVVLDHESQDIYEVRVRATDSGGSARDNLFTIQVVDINEPPIANEDAAETDEDTALSIDVLQNDHDVDAGDVVILAEFDTASELGAVITASAGNLEYDPSNVEVFQALRGLHQGNPTETLVDRFSYTIDDGHGERRTAVVTVTVSGVNDWHNEALNVDVNNNGSVEPLDALVIINTLNEVGSRSLSGIAGVPTAYYDSNSDNFVSAVDALQVINYLNDPPLSAEGEAQASPSPVGFWLSSNAASNNSQPNDHHFVRTETKATSAVRRAPPSSGSRWEITDDDQRRRGSVVPMRQLLDEELESILDEIVSDLAAQSSSPTRAVR